MQPHRPKSYKSHCSKLKSIVSQTGNIKLATKSGVPRTTAIYWANKTYENSAHTTSEISLLNEEIKRLQVQIEIEKYKLIFINKLSPYIEAIKNSKKNIHKSIQRLVIKTIEQFRKYLSLNLLLSLIHMSASRFYQWQASFKKCDYNKKFYCASRKPNQLTGDEVLKILCLSTSKKYAHFSTTALWKYSVINNLVVCSKGTWFKYLKYYKVNRKPDKKEKSQYLIGIRAKKSNEIWHIDITEIKDIHGNKFYLQIIVDNFSRYIVNWSLNSSKESINTVKLIKDAKRYTKQSLQLYMDSGSENKNHVVSKLLLGFNISRVLAKIDVKYSNSVVEAVFRSLKSNFLRRQTIKNKRHLKCLISFYIKEYNYSIPHNTFEYATPAEIFNNTWSKEKIKTINSYKLTALQNRKEANLKPIDCSVCKKI